MRRRVVIACGTGVALALLDTGAWTVRRAVIACGTGAALALLVTAGCIVADAVRAYRRQPRR